MANVGTDILGLPLAISLDGTEQIPLVQAGTTKRAPVSMVGIGTITQFFPAGIDYVMMGGTEVVPTGVQGTGLVVPFDMEITGYVLTGNLMTGGATSGNAVVDIWKCTQAQYDGGITHPVVGDSITDSNTPAIVAGTIATGTPTGWTATLTEGDILWYNVNSIDTFRSITLAIACSRVIP